MEPGKHLTPDLIFEAINSYQASFILKAAIRLGFFSAVEETGSTAPELAEACEVSQKGARVLADSLTVHGFLDKENGRYTLAEVSQTFLRKDAQAYLGDMVDFLLSPMLVDSFFKFEEAVVKGGTAHSDEGTLDPENPVWIKFARAMMPMMMPSAQAIAGVLDYPEDKALKVLDIAASHGIFGITIAQKFPNAEIHGLDWKNVLEVAEENAQRFGIADRYRKIEGSAFEVEFGEGYDVVLLPNFLHHFPAEKNTQLIEKIGKSLNEDGSVITLEFVPNEDRVAPRGEALFAAVMLATTPEGDAFTFSELDKMFRNGGFPNNKHIPLTPLPQHIVVSRKS